jgi:hypothetical protein
MQHHLRPQTPTHNVLHITMHQYETTAYKGRACSIRIGSRQGKPLLGWAHLLLPGCLSSTPQRKQPSRFHSLTVLQVTGLMGHGSGERQKETSECWCLPLPAAHATVMPHVQKVKHKQRRLDGMGMSRSLGGAENMIYTHPSSTLVRIVTMTASVRLHCRWILAQNIRNDTMPLQAKIMLAAHCKPVLKP